jgi:hypothetical protein
VDDTVRGKSGERSQISSQFDSLQLKFDSFVDSSLRLMGSLLLKAVILPLIFLYGVLLLGRRLIDIS